MAIVGQNRSVSAAKKVFLPKGVPLKKWFEERMGDERHRKFLKKTPHEVPTRTSPCETRPVNPNKNQPELLQGTGNPKKETPPVNPNKNQP